MKLTEQRTPTDRPQTEYADENRNKAQAVPKKKRKKKWRRRQLDREKIAINKQKIKEKKRRKRAEKKEKIKEAVHVLSEKMKGLAETAKNGKVTRVSYPVMTTVSAICILLAALALYRVFKIDKENIIMEAFGYQEDHALYEYSKTMYQKILLKKDAGMDSAGAPVEAARYMIEGMRARLPEVELTQENTADFATIESCTINSETGKVDVRVSLSGVAASDDGYYYLFEEKTYDTALTSEEYIIEEQKGMNLTISVNLNYNQPNSRLFSKFVLAVKKDGEFVAISRPKYITNPEAIAKYTSSFAQTTSKKGLLVDPNKLSGSELDDLGVRHAAYNIFLSRIVNASGSYSVSYGYNGKTYHFNRAVVEEYDHVFSTLTKKGITTTAIILNDMSSHTELIHPLARSGGTAPYYAFNAAEESGVEYLAAVASFLAERYSGSNHGKVMNWVIGNEINARSEWNYIQYMDTESYAKEYARAFRVFYNAIKSINGNARVYISLDQQWGQSLYKTNSYGSKEVLDAFNAFIKKDGNIDWGVAQHPYNYPLTSAKAWSTAGKAGSLILDSETTPVLSIRNIHVLSDYLQKEEMLTDSGEVRHIILSEMGYTSTAGQDLQAASFVYAYKIVEANPYIDSMLLSRQTDSGVEAAMGLALGLNTQGGGHKSIYNVYKYIDTPQSSSYTDFALHIIGISSWNEVVKKY